MLGLDQYPIIRRNYFGRYRPAHAGKCGAVSPACGTSPVNARVRLSAIKQEFIPTQHQVYDPTTSNVRCVDIAAVVEDVVVVAPGILKGIGQNRHRGEVTRDSYICRASEKDGGRCQAGSRATDRNGLPTMSVRIDWSSFHSSGIRAFPR